MVDTSFQKGLNTVHFDDALKYEQTRFEQADAFYKKLGYENLERCSWDTKEGRTLQKQDIDIIFHQNNEMFPEESYDVYVSEKFRSTAHDDIILELYSNWNREVPGSYIVSHADWLMYWNGYNQVYQLDAQKLKERANKLLIHTKKFTQEEKNDLISDFWLEKSIDNIKYKFRSFRSINKNYEEWRSLCVIIPWNQLEDCIIKVHTL